MTTEYIPKVGMSFESEEKLYHFYNYYGRRAGFSIRKVHFKRSSDGESEKGNALFKRRIQTETLKRYTTKRKSGFADGMHGSDTWNCKRWYVCCKKFC
ncbi:hypothetical protein MKX01_015197 [Papaver californicum]|nr:hypothetical protein MKX01_015197 [Papaver californicum]